MTANLQNPIFQDDAKAREWLEARVWPDGPVCSHCGNADQAKITGLKGKAHRPGVYQCNEPACREQFTVTVGTVFERSKIPLSKWMAALFQLTASKKLVSAHQIHCSLAISYKSAWFMMHRLREALRQGGSPRCAAPARRSRSTKPFPAFRAGANWKTPRKATQFHRVVLTLVQRGGSARRRSAIFCRLSAPISIRKARL